MSASGLGLVSPFTNVRAICIYLSESLTSCHPTWYTRVPTRAKEDDQHIVTWYLLSSDEDYYNTTLNRSFAHSASEKTLKSAFDERPGCMSANQLNWPWLKDFMTYLEGIDRNLILHFLSIDSDLLHQNDPKNVFPCIITALHCGLQGYIHQHLAKGVMSEHWYATLSSIPSFDNGKSTYASMYAHCALVFRYAQNYHP